MVSLRFYFQGLGLPTVKHTSLPLVLQLREQQRWRRVFVRPELAAAAAPIRRPTPSTVVQCQSYALLALLGCACVLAQGLSSRRLNPEHNVP